MLKLMITEFKKNISIRNTTFCSIIVLVCFFCLCFVIESYQDSTIEALATNYYTSHSFEYFQIDEKNEYEIQSYIDNKPVESTLSDEEVLETFERYAQIHVEITDALYGSDIDRINELLLEEENIRILLKGKNYYIEELKKSPLYEKCKGNLICSNESVEKEALPPLEMAQYNLKHHIPYKSMDAYIMQADDYIYTIETILFVVLIPILGLFMSYLCLNQEKKEHSDKLTWCLPYPRMKILLSKIIATFIYATLVLTCAMIAIYCFMGLKYGFNSSMRLAVIDGWKILSTIEYANRYIVMKQWQLNGLIYLFSLFGLMVTIVLTYTISTLIQNKKTVFAVGGILLMASLIIPEYIYTNNLYQLYPLFAYCFSVYRMVPYFLNGSTIYSSGLSLSLCHSGSTSLSKINLATNQFQSITLCRGLIVGLFTIVILLCIANFSLKKKDKI